MSEFSFSNSCKKNKILPSSSSLPSHFFNVLFFFFLSPYLLTLLFFFSPLFITTISLLAFSPPNLNDGSETCDSKMAFLLSLVESLVQKLSSRNDENDEGIRCFEEFQAYLDVFRPPIFEVFEESCSESRYSGDDEGRESRAHVRPTGKQPDSTFDGNPSEQDDGEVEAAKPIAEENMFSEKECKKVLEENYSESGYSGDDGRESTDHVGPMEKQPNLNFDENPFEDDNDDDDKVEAAWPITEDNIFCQKECREILQEKSPESGCPGDEGRGHVDLTEEPTVNLEENPDGEDDDVDKVEKNTKIQDMFCQKRDKEVKPRDTNSNKAEESSKGKMTLRNGSKVMCNDDDGRIDAKDSTANSEEEEYFGTPQRNWDYFRSYGSMRKEKEWRRTLACKLYEERSNVNDGSEAMDLLWETYEDTEPEKVKRSNTNSEDTDDDEEEKEVEKEKGLEGKYCCLQALKFSAGKMNLGMRKPSLVKISKALKSIALLHHVSKHGRKKIH